MHELDTIPARPHWIRSQLRALILLIIGAGLIGWQLWVRHIPTRAHDRVGAIPSDKVAAIDQALHGLMIESGVDLRMLIDSVPAGADLSEFALKEARRLGIGRTSDRRSVLLVVDAASGGLRFEIGPQMEGIFPDAFVGRLLRAHVAGARERVSIDLVLSSTLKVLHHRIRQAQLNLEYDPRVVTDIADSVRLAAGGGATFAGGFEQPLRLDLVADTVLETMLGPGKTAEEVLQQFKTWLSLPVYVPRARFLTRSSRSFYEHQLPMTPAYWDFVRLMYVNSAMEVEERGDLAVAYGTEDPLVEPLTFRRTHEGWQLDVIAELLHSQSMVGGEYSWMWLPQGDEYDRAFADIFYGPDWGKRFKYGANQMLPIRGGK